MGRRGEREAAGEGEVEPAEGRGRVCGSDGGGALLGAGREKKNIAHPEEKKIMVSVPYKYFFSFSLYLFSFYFKERTDVCHDVCNKHNITTVIFVICNRTNNTRKLQNYEAYYCIIFTSSSCDSKEHKN